MELELADSMIKDALLNKRREKTGRGLGWSQRRLAIALIVPAFIVVFALIIYPIGQAFWDSLHSIHLIRRQSGQPFVGLQNYIDIFQDRYFWASVGRTLYFMVVSISIELVLGIAVALLLNREFVGRSVLRSLMLIPWALPIIIDGIMWKWIFNPNYGALNSLLWQLGLIDKYKAWLSHPLSALNMVIIADIWKVTPLVILLSLASLQTIPATLYEAGRVDGTNAWTAFRHITLPLLMPTIAIVLVIRSMDAFKVFDLIYIMTRGGPADGTKVIAYYTYLETFQDLKFGRGAALAYLMTFFIGIMALVYIKLLSREIEY
ncbi:MAG: carbohydrate ABC transporter permease [Anaerolineae bacterium]